MSRHKKKQKRNGTCGCNVGETERLLSALSGGVMILQGLRKRSPLGLAIAAIGMGSVYRGVTGHCALYEALGVDTNAPKPVTVQEEINADARNAVSNTSKR